MLCPFSEKPKFQSHIQATKGRVVKKNTLNYDALDYSKPVHPQFQQQIGRGNRLTTGKICCIPLTHSDNIKLFEALDKEKITLSEGKAATARKKKGKPSPGDDKLIEVYQNYLREEAKVKLEHARSRQEKGEVSKADEKLLRSRLAKSIEKEMTPRPPVEPPLIPKSNAGTQRRTRSASEKNELLAKKKKGLI